LEENSQKIDQNVKRGVNPGLKVLACLLVFYSVIKFGVQPPLPSSLIFMYMSLATVGGIVFLVLFHDLGEMIFSPIFAFLGGGVSHPIAKACRLIILVAIPLVIWLNSYQQLGQSVAAPLEQRVIHPAPPGETMGLFNPFGKEDGDEAEKKAHIEEGRQVYFKNCVFCHGDLLDGNGIFAGGLNPPPANFQDPGTIAMLQESFLFWRISTGGIGLPKESTPWNSAMPRWETMLTTDERWKVIMFLYDYTGHHPRTWE
jgi:mono/diheme cytochrome c family protein